MTATSAALRPHVASAPLRLGRQAWKPVLVLTLVAAGLWTATHGVAGVAWTDVLAVLRDLQVRQLALLGLIWLGGLTLYATVLSTALPGLGVRRSLLLNLSGSAVANVFPLGGAVATGMNWRMVRAWGHSNLAFLTFCLLTNALDVASKLLLPVVAVAALAFFSVHVPLALWCVAAACAAVLLVSGVVQALTLGVRAGTVTTGAEQGRSGWRRFRAHVGQTVVGADRLLRQHWGRLVPASIGYVAAQVVLLAMSLRVVGLHAPLTVVLMAAAVERLGSLIPLTPAGAGFAEIGAIAWLVANGLDPVEVVAGVLLYRIFLIVMEIPVGGVLLGSWVWLQRPRSRRSASA